MFLFQLEARLFSYVYTFHQGIILIESILLGAGIFLVLNLGLSKRQRQFLTQHTPVFILLAFFIQIFLFFHYHIFFIDLLALSLLFGFIFLQITRFISLPAHHFYGTELFGSFVGVALYIVGVSYLLEEKLLLIAAVALLLYTLATIKKTKYFLSLFVVAVVFFGMFSVSLFQRDLVSLIQCSTVTASYKASCLDDLFTIKPVASFTHLKGRTDVYFKELGDDRVVVTMRSGGYYVAEATHRDNLAQDPIVFAEPRIPLLDYKAESRVLDIGVSIGGSVQAFQKYIENPVITGVDIDRTIEQIYRDERFEPYVADTNTYTSLFIDGRRFIEQSEEQYDVIDAAVDVVNSTLGQYVDERSSLLYTTRALRKYREHLSPGGYLILEQYYPKAEYGDAMVVKMLNTLFAAQDRSKEEFRGNILMYTWSFGSNPSAQRFAITVYKNSAFSNDDFRKFAAWHAAMNNFSVSAMQNPDAITLLHVPKNSVIPAQTYTPFFSDDVLKPIREQYNTSVITDDKPFRHLITTLPFPTFFYVLFLGFLALFLILIGKSIEKIKSVVPTDLLALSALFGIATFGLQYLLFYKTAAFLDTNLIFFSVFLVIPLFFSSIGGYFSVFLSRRYLIVLATFFVFIAGVLAAIDVFTSTALFVFTAIALLFFFSGFLFPMLIHPVISKDTRSMIYAVNIFAGGFAYLVMITLHATIGWVATFAIVILTVIGGVLVMVRRRMLAKLRL